MYLDKKRTLVAVVTMLCLVLLAACGGGTPAASQAADVAAATQAPTVAAEPTAAVEPTTAPVADSSAQATEAPAADAPAAEASGAAGSKTFMIDPSQSEVRFTLTEVLMGQHTIVIGRGNGIEGNVTVDFDNNANSAISPIKIDATQLATDNNMRNGQIRRAILQTNNPDYQFITFTPTAVTGLPANATVGESFDISVTGDLTIRDTTKPITFDVAVTPVSESQIQGSAKATLMRDDFNLQIPSVPTVADVSQDVELEFDFVANAE